MGYKVLVMGKNDSAIDVFFNQMDDDFTVLSCSTRYEDIVGHINYFVPDVLVYCLYDEPRDNIVRMISVNSKLMRSDIPFVILGSKEDCDMFEKIAVNVASLVLYRPLSAKVIKAEIQEFMKKRSKPAKDGENDAFAGMSGLESLALSGFDFSQEPSFPSGFGNPIQNKKHILVVDDNAMMLKVIKEYLHDKYDVATAVSGKVALRFLESKTTDLILLDYEMPQENGLAVLEKLRASDATKDIPVIFLTGVTETKKIKEAIVLKPQGYLLKPVKREKLLAEIEKLIG
ncbi:MAG: response regulator [Lachnospiraceae bacterium]|nr:response regulator [Lachnospiraceae bacterium]